MPDHSPFFLRFFSGFKSVFLLPLQKNRSFRRAGADGQANYRIIPAEKQGKPYHDERAAIRRRTPPVSAGRNGES